MIIEPKVKGFICTTAHPEGCAESVRRQIAITRAHGMTDGPKKSLSLDVQQAMVSPAELPLHLAVVLLRWA